MRLIIEKILEELTPMIQISKSIQNLRDKIKTKSDKDLPVKIPSSSIDISIKGLFVTLIKESGETYLTAE